MIPRLMETNVYALRGRVLVVGACLPQMWPEQFRQLAAEYDQVYGLCLETTHVNMAITKLAAATVDRSPHCTQMHYIRHEIERTLPEHVPVESYVVSDGKIVAVPEGAVELSKSLARLAQISE